MKNSREYISMPLPIDNLFGETINHSTEIIILLAVIAGIWIGYVVLLVPFGITYVVPLVFSIGFLLFWLSEIFGKGKAKREFYKKQLSGDLAQESNIINISMIDGQDVFYGGMVANFIVGEFVYYIDGNQLTLDFEAFLDSIAPFMYNLYFVESLSEDTFEENIPGIKMYNDEQVAKDRFDFYLYQMELMKSIKRYKVIIAIRSSINDITTLHEKVENILIGDNTGVFSHIFLAKDEELNLVLGADLDYDQDVQTMLDTKYYNKASMPDLTIVERG